MPRSRLDRHSYQVEYDIQHWSGAGSAPMRWVCSCGQKSTAWRDTVQECRDGHERHRQRMLARGLVIPEDDFQYPGGAHVDTVRFDGVDDYLAAPRTWSVDEFAVTLPTREAGDLPVIVTNGRTFVLDSQDNNALMFREIPRPDVLIIQNGVFLIRLVNEHHRPGITPHHAQFYISSNEINHTRAELVVVIFESAVERLVDIIISMDTEPDWDNFNFYISWQPGHGQPPISAEGIEESRNVLAHAVRTVRANMEVDISEAIDPTAVMDRLDEFSRSHVGYYHVLDDNSEAWDLLGPTQQ